MKQLSLLLDENLSPDLVKALAARFPGIAHVLQFNLKGMPDVEIRRFAAEHNFCVVSKDSDYEHLAFVLGAPPKIIWLRIGEATIAQTKQCLLSNRNVINEFLSAEETAVLELR